MFSNGQTIVCLDCMLSLFTSVDREGKLYQKFFVLITPLFYPHNIIRTYLEYIFHISKISIDTFSLRFLKNWRAIEEAWKERDWAGPASTADFRFCVHSIETSASSYGPVLSDINQNRPRGGSLDHYFCLQQDGNCHWTEVNTKLSTIDHRNSSLRIQRSNCWDFEVTRNTPRLLLLIRSHTRPLQFVITNLNRRKFRFGTR